MKIQSNNHKNKKAFLQLHLSGTYNCIPVFVLCKVHSFPANLVCLLESARGSKNIGVRKKDDEKQLPQTENVVANRPILLKNQAKEKRLLGREDSTDESAN